MLVGADFVLACTTVTEFPLSTVSSDGRLGPGVPGALTLVPRAGCLQQVHAEGQSGGGTLSRVRRFTGD